MIIVRFKKTFRERMPEWIQATGMLLWGLLCLGNPGLFESREFYFPLMLIMPQLAWGAIATLTGIARLVFLVINGAWRPSAHIRAIGCAFGTMLWGSLLVSALSLEWVSTAVAVYLMLTITDILSLWFAAGDAKLADLSARGKLRTQ